MDRDIPDTYIALMDAIVELGWQIAIPFAKDDDIIEGMIIGTEEYIDNILNKDKWLGFIYSFQWLSSGDSSFGGPSLNKEQKRNDTENNSNNIRYRPLLPGADKLGGDI